ncbi:hypothetical protein [Lacinutrix chionoecetis]
MKIVDSPLFECVKETHHLSIGDFYFLKNAIIAEIREGVHIDLESSQEFFEIANSYYNKPFGYVSNRINQFSVSPMDFANYSVEIENIISFCAVLYDNRFDQMNVQIEKRFSHKPFHIVYKIADAISWTNNNIANFKSISA